MSDEKENEVVQKAQDTAAREGISKQKSASKHAVLLQRLQSIDKIERNIRSLESERDKFKVDYARLLAISVEQYSTETYNNNSREQCNMCGNAI